jgi:hypothetical protein
MRCSRASSIWITIALVGCVLACRSPAPERAAHAATGDLVDEVSSLQLHSAFWLNLHHVLYAEAWARRGVPPRRSLAGVFPAPLRAALTAEEQAAWERAVAYYDRALASEDLLFDDDLGRVRQALLAGGPQLPAHGLAPEHAAVLAAAAPVYRGHWWPAHDRANRAWIAAVVPRVRALSPAVPDRLARLYGRPWFSTPVRVDVVFIANRQGAYTSLLPAPAHLTISASDTNKQDWAAAEIVFHEASHALVQPVQEAYDREATAAAKSLPVLWHVALFYLTGEVVRQTLASRGIAYTPYLYATGLFARAWSDLQAPLERYWRPYVDGEVSLPDAVRQVVGAAPSAR